MSETWQETVRKWLYFPYGTAACPPPTGWCDISRNEAAARLLRTIRMPHIELDGAWYRYAVCTLERMDTPGYVAGTWTWHSPESLASAARYALEDSASGFELCLAEVYALYKLQVANNHDPKRALLAAAGFPPGLDAPRSRELL